MKALILNSGIGKRLFPLTEKVPKALVEVNGKAILGYQLDCLKNCGIKDLIMTTGPFETLIQKYIELNYPTFKVTYVKNPEFRTTNYIYSMWLAKDFIDEETLLIHGDLLFDVKLLERLINGEKSDYVLVNKTIIPPDKDFKAKIEKERVVKIGTYLSGENTYFCAPFYKLSLNSYRLWFEAIREEIGKANLRIYAEEAFNSKLENIFLSPLFFKDERCLEVDDFSDLDIAVKSFSI